jgi:hypothetical protein
MQPECGSYKTIIIPPPRWPKKRDPNGTLCITPDGCDVQHPMGGWLTPMRLENIGAWTSGDPIEENLALQLSYPGVIRAIAVEEITVNSTGALLTPANVRIGKWSSTKMDQLYPGWGARTAGTGSVALALDQQKPTQLMRPITGFSQQALLDHLNAQPRPLQNLDASEDNSLFRFSVDHKKTVAIDILLALYIGYNSAEG